MDLDLYVHDKSIESPDIARSFKDEIIFEWYLKLNDFLLDEEIKVVTPNTYGEITIGEKKPLEKKDNAKILFKLSKILFGKERFNSINDIFNEYLIISEKVEDRERNPENLKQALKKIENHLIKNSTKLPVVHSIYEDRQLKKEVNQLEIGGINVNIEGDLFYLDNYKYLRNKIQLKSYLDDYGKIDDLIEVKPEIQINNKIYYTKTKTKAEQFENEFKKCFSFLDKAIKLKKKILWEFG